MYAIRSYYAVAIENQAAVRWQGDDRNAIVFGARVVVLVLNELQPHEAGAEQPEGHEHHGGGDQHAGAERMQLTLGVAQFGQADHRRVPVLERAGFEGPALGQ